jgi:serine/threonine protein phosphatase PrpC
VLALVQERQLTVANVGDSVAVLARGGEALRLSRGHHAGSDVEETQRVLLAGGLVASAKPGAPPRVWKSGIKYGHAGLMMTRLVSSRQLLHSCIAPQDSSVRMTIDYPLRCA